MFHKADKTLGCRILVGFEDHTLLMVQQSGAVAWTREEALASMAALEMLDLPGGQEAAIESFVSYAKAEGNPIKLAMRRLQLQLTLTKVGSTHTCVRVRICHGGLGGGGGRGG